MKAEERKDLETNALARGVGTLVDRAKSGRWNYRLIGLVLLVVLVGGSAWYLWSVSQRGTSQQWTDLARANTQVDLKKVADDHPDSTAGRVARLQLARIQLGPEGIAQLSDRNREKRTKGIESVESARKDLTKLADEFADDKALQAASLQAAAEAELALVGIPQDGSPASRGSVDKAVELYRKVAMALGEGTPAGEEAKKRADELARNKDQIENVGRTLHDYLSVSSSFTAPIPGLDGPKLPPSLTPDPNTPPPTPPKPPETITPPGGTAPTNK
jgi:hypothetical protein